MTDTKQKRSFGLLDDLRYLRIGDARISPNGKLAVYEVTQNNLEKDETFSSLWCVHLDNGEIRQLTYGANSDTSPAWSPDGKQIAFLSNRSGIKQIFLLPADGGEARPLTDLKQGVDGRPVWSPDGETIAFTAPLDTEPIDPMEPYRVTRHVYRFDGAGYLDDAVQNIYVQSVHGGHPEQLTADAHLDRTLRWSPNGDEILYLASHDPDRADLFSAKLRVMNLAGEMDEILGLDWGFIKNCAWTPDGSQIIFVASTGEQPMAAKDDLWMISRQGGTAENRTQDLEWGVEVQWYPVFSSGKLLNTETAVLVNVVKTGTKGVYSVALTGEPDWQPLLGGERTITLQDADASRMLFLSGDLENPGELHIAKLDGSNERRITHVNQRQMDEIAFPKIEHLLYESEAGIQIEGWLLIPTQGAPPYPTVLYIHGGPHGWYGHQYGSDFQMLAGAGYAVLFVNPRGSTGYGDDFATALSGHWGVMDYKDLMAGVDYVIEKGFADPDRLGICGLSYGGFLTCFTVGQTNRFKAAVAENPITDLVSRYGTADMGPWGSLSELGGSPHEIPEVYRRSSPITYAHNCTTPTLLIQGEADYRCPAGQSEQFYTHLKANGCIVEMIRFPGMSHVASINGPIKVQKTQNEALLGWMNEYVLPR